MGEFHKTIAYTFHQHSVQLNTLRTANEPRYKQVDIGDSHIGEFEELEKDKDNIVSAHFLFLNGGVAPYSLVKFMIALKQCKKLNRVTYRADYYDTVLTAAIADLFDHLPSLYEIKILNFAQQANNNLFQTLIPRNKPIKVFINVRDYFWSAVSQEARLEHLCDFIATTDNAQHIYLSSAGFVITYREIARIREAAANNNLTIVEASMQIDHEFFGTERNIYRKKLEIATVLHKQTVICGDLQRVILEHLSH